MAPRDQSTFLCCHRAWLWICSNLQTVPRPPLHLWYRNGWCLGSCISNRAGKSSCRGAWSRIWRTPTGIRLRIPPCSSHKSPSRSSHLHYVAYAVLGFGGHLGVCRLHSRPCSRERVVHTRTRRATCKGRDNGKEDEGVHSANPRNAEEALASVRLRRASHDWCVGSVI